MRQRELGLQQLAGTADMAIDGHPSTFTPGPGARGTVTLVLTCNTYLTCTYNNNKDMWYCNAAVTVCNLAQCSALRVTCSWHVPHRAYVPLHQYLRSG